MVRAPSAEKDKAKHAIEAVQSATHSKGLLSAPLRDHTRGAHQILFTRTKKDKGGSKRGVVVLGLELAFVFVCDVNEVDVQRSLDN